MNRMSEQQILLSPPGFLQQLKASFMQSLKFQILVDVEIVCGEVSFSCHRIVLAASSGYFFERFSKLNKVVFQRLNLPFMSPSTFQIILKFIYSGCLNMNGLSSRQVEAVKLGLIQLDMIDVTGHRMKVMMRSLDSMSFVQIWSKAVAYRQKEMGRNIASYVAENLEDCSENPTFLFLTLQQVIAILSCPKSRLAKESTIRKSLQIWVLGDFAVRERYVTSLLSVAKLSASSRRKTLAFFQHQMQIRGWKASPQKNSLKRNERQNPAKKSVCLSTVNEKQTNLIEYILDGSVVSEVYTLDSCMTLKRDSVVNRSKIDKDSGLESSRSTYVLLPTTKFNPCTITSSSIFSSTDSQVFPLSSKLVTLNMSNISINERSNDEDYFPSPIGSCTKIVNIDLSFPSPVMEPVIVTIRETAATSTQSFRIPKTTSKITATECQFLSHPSSLGSCCSTLPNFASTENSSQDFATPEREKAQVIPEDPQNTDKQKVFARLSESKSCYWHLFPNVQNLATIATGVSSTSVKTISTTRNQQNEESVTYRKVQSFIQKLSKNMGKVGMNKSLLTVQLDQHSSDQLNYLLCKSNENEGCSSSRPTEVTSLKAQLDRKVSKMQEMLRQYCQYENMESDLKRARDNLLLPVSPNSLLNKSSRSQSKQMDNDGDVKPAATNSDSFSVSQQLGIAIKQLKKRIKPYENSAGEMQRTFELQSETLDQFNIANTENKKRLPASKDTRKMLMDVEKKLILCRKKLIEYKPLKQMKTSRQKTNISTYEYDETSVMKKEQIKENSAFRKVIPTSSLDSLKSYPKSGAAVLESRKFRSPVDQSIQIVGKILPQVESVAFDSRRSNLVKRIVDDHDKMTIDTSDNKYEQSQKL